MEPPLFRNFRRHYHRTRDAYDALAESGNISLRIEYREGQLRVAHEISDEKCAVRFFVLMRPFLHPDSPMYYQTLWKALKDGFPELVRDEAVKRIASLEEKLRSGQLKVLIDGQTYAGETAYEIIADGQFFQSQDEPRQFLGALAESPVARAILWDEFVRYNSVGFELISALFDVFLGVRDSEAYRSTYATEPASGARCIYCLTTAGDFISEEHIVPEALGNDELILPEGYVCQKCNNEILSQLDNYLIEFEPIAFLRVSYVPYTKDGKLPKASFQNVAMEKTQPRHISITAKDKSGQIKDKQKLEDGWSSFRIEVRGKSCDPERLGRALYKIGLGIVALSKGADYACCSRYDDARRFIVEGGESPNELLLRTVSRAHPRCEVVFYERVGSMVFIDIYGVMFILNLEKSPPIEASDELKAAGFTSFSDLWAPG